MWRDHTFLFGLVVGVLALPCIAESQVERLALGQGGLDWREVGEEFIGLDDAAVAGSLQPSELDPAVDIAVGTQAESGQFTNIFGHVWEISGSPPPYVQDITPWVYGSRGRTQTIDGDIDRPTDVVPLAARCLQPLVLYVDILDFKFYRVAAGARGAHVAGAISSMPCALCIGETAAGQTIEVAPLIFVAAGLEMQDRNIKSAQFFYAIRG